jgi:hypothetical protein
MIKSAEIRYIFPGNPPADLFKIFIDSKLLSRQPSREDIYLQFPSSSTVGVKFREANFEIKPLVKSLGNFDINNKVSGNIQIWEKWSCSAQEVKTFYDIAIKEDKWIKVRKERWIRKFINFPEIQEVLADSNPAKGCDVELTKILKQGKYYWSLAFETFGSSENPENILKEISAYFFDKILTKVTFALSDRDEGSFNLSNSLSYPLWLINEQF